MAKSAPPEPHLGIERICLRDLSFESPRAPAAFASEWRPRVRIEIDTRANRLDEGRFEVVLTLTLEAMSDSDESTLLVVELQQAGIFRVEGMDEAMRRHVLAVICPNALFPCARKTVDTMVTKGTFPPFMLAPVNVDALYAESRRRRETGRSETS